MSSKNSFAFFLILFIFLITINKCNGSVKLCPLGGRSFFQAMHLICPTRRKKFLFRKENNNNYRPATFFETMFICCEYGCEYRDLLPHCSPTFL
uniref:IlGF domain-containing protein n=1 Tax=Parastrongyloides trichosuri TaxID=131310 RepID=A0A0N4ZVB1_PARTI